MLHHYGYRFIGKGVYNSGYLVRAHHLRQKAFDDRDLSVKRGYALGSAGFFKSLSFVLKFLFRLLQNGYYVGIL